MAKVQGGTLSIDTAAISQLQKTIDGAKSDDQLVRMKTGKDGAVFAVLGEARGNMFSKSVAVVEKTVNNSAAAVAFTRQISQEGTSGATLSQNAIDTAISERSVVTVGDVRAMLQQGATIDKARNLPHNSLQDLANHLEAYSQAGTIGTDLLAERLAELNAHGASDTASIASLTQLLNHPSLEGQPALKQVIDKTALAAVQNAVKTNNPAAAKALLAQLHNLDDVSSLKASLNQAAKTGGLPGLEGYNQIVTREAELIGVREAQTALAGNDPQALTDLTTTLTTMKFSGRAKFNQQLQQQALASAKSVIDSQLAVKAELPNLDSIAFELADNPAEIRGKEFQENFATGVAMMVARGEVTVPELEDMHERLESGQQPKTDTTALKKMVRTALHGEKRGEAIVNNNTRFAATQKKTNSALQRTAHSPLKGHFRGVNSPQATNVPVAVPKGNGLAAPAQNTIHANFVPFAGKNTAIATQYPASGTTSPATFWRMTQQQNSHIIMDLTQPKDINKGLQLYYPTQVGATEEYDGVQVTLMGDNNGYLDYQVTDTVTGETSNVYRYHYQGWVDHGKTDTAELANLAAILNHDAFENTVVHCRAGVGRTATVYCAAKLANMVKAGQINATNKDEQLDAMITEMRMARGALAVQTKEQRMVLSDLVDYWLENGV